MPAPAAARALGRHRDPSTNHRLNTPNSQKLSRIETRSGSLFLLISTPLSNQR